MTTETITRIDSGPRLSKAVVANGFVFLAGMTARDTKGDVRAQTADILAQIDSYLAKAGTDKSRLVSVNIWLKDISTFAEMNAAWTDWADPANLPARATVEARLASDDLLVEIMAKALTGADA